MADHRIPVLAGVLGLLGGVGGAAVGGYVANVGQEQRFEHERATQIRDLRIDTYVRFLRAAEREHNEGPATEDRIVRSAEAEVALLAPSDDVRRAAGVLTENTLEGGLADYTQLRNRFIEVAQAELEN